MDGLCRLQTVQGGEAKCRFLHFLCYGRCPLVDMHEKRHPRMIQRLEQQRQHLGRGVCDDEKGVAFVGLHKRQEERSEAHSTHLCEKVLEAGIGEEVMFGSQRVGHQSSHHAVVFFFEFSRFIQVVEVAPVSSAVF